MFWSRTITGFVYRGPYLWYNIEVFCRLRVHPDTIQGGLHTEDLSLVFRRLNLRFTKYFTHEVLLQIDPETDFQIGRRA